ncbi:MAG: P-II family nitrogen regulator [Limnochordia bacterium]|jgi:nitrogen regulatory protein PII|nr:P-II family nitrogen regulator [Limnochordia bacterium]MDI9463989.1 P-II family nitrogen regulator [Bacillota bacterium]NLO94615.1 P-II family nitrogen regulator [Bacillota bacterium]HAN95613.1 transcriptional regulator [Bacillota bacterium]HOB40947.1 P-II family nitrogen regulator [Limnochordia bacterium]
MQQTRSGEQEYELLCVIVDFGLGSKVVSMAKKNGISGGTIALGRGTVSGRLAELLGLTDTRKEIVFLAAKKLLGRNALKMFADELHLNKPKGGIAFAMPLGAFLGTGSYAYEFRTQRGGAGGMYRAVFVVVDKGRGEEVMDVARAAGAKGGTIINARGSSIHETRRFLNLEIEPEKEMVLILARPELADAIVVAVRDELKIHEPGRGIIFVQDVSEVYGVVED